ncbi:MULTISPECIES: PTS sugar transporter subunit IIA [Lactobacillus]|uniref:PRD domain-containing protein n=1 Tax=Lactobacillus xujianguonis TaxID=2495899 RepID=A0A437SWS9_9LACO|nr:MULTISPECIES: PTS sugar transporter subunit IIA [Lactobacillus]RVU71386.1 PRD domain-containing protein [Lactobacillus xujianguonis]RVU76953.1 PRD domain-containing protein [Lactobacillus xujianguonis]
MNSDLYKIIRILIENGPTTIDELAYLENVSRRTIENRIKDLSQTLEKVVAIVKRGNAYSLAVLDFNLFYEMQYKYLQNGFNVDDPEEKSLRIIYELIKQPDYTSIDNLADKLTLDKRSISRNISDKAKYLALYFAQATSKQGKGIKISFQNEAMILLLMRNIMTLGHGYVDTDRFDKIFNSLDQKFTDKKLLKKIVLNILVLEKVRNCRGQINDRIPFFYPLWDQENSEIQTLTSWFKVHFMGLTAAETEFLLSPLNLNKNIYTSEVKLEQVFNENRKLVYSSLKKSVLNYGLNTDTVYFKIKWHILFLINRCVLRQNLKETLPKETAEKYPVAFEFALSLVEIIETKYEAKVSLGEINYLVLYFQQAIDELDTGKINSAEKIAVIKTFRSSANDFLGEKIKSKLPNAEIAIFKNKKELLKDNHDYLFVLSRMPFVYKDIPVVNPNIVFKKDKLSILITIALIQKYIKQKLIKVVRHDLTAKTYYQTVEELVGLLSEDYELTTDFYQRWTEREKKSNNVISNGIAIPHAVDNSGKQRILLSFGIVKSSVTYKKTKLKLVALIGIPEDLNTPLVEATSELYDFISMVIRNEVLLENAEKYDNTRSFIQMLEGI